jgi:hypothetical protein
MLRRRRRRHGRETAMTEDQRLIIDALDLFIESNNRLVMLLRKMHRWDFNRDEERVPSKNASLVDGLLHWYIRATDEFADLGDRFGLDLATEIDRKFLEFPEDDWG